MTKALTVHNASISTASVEIKTLTVSGKQVTLATFRQLRNEELIGDDGNLLGLPWGTVNYHPDKCGDSSQHEHVVWQKGDELRRARVSKPWFGSYWPTVDMSDWMLVHGTVRDPHHAELRDEDELHWAWPDFVGRYGWREAGFDFLITATDIDDPGRERYPSTGRFIKRERYKHAISRAEEQYRQLIPELEAEARRRSRHLDRWAEVLALPQLFIAT